MCTLIIDTSTKKSFVIFADGPDLLLSLPLPIGDKSSSYLMPTIVSGFQELKISPSHLKAVAVGLGPGSYTGTRVGVAAAKGIAFPFSIPLIGFCSLQAFVSKEDGVFATVFDARMGGFYALLQEKSGREIKPHSSPQIFSKDELKNLLIKCGSMVSPETDDPDPSHLAFLIDEKIKAGEGGEKLELLYLRKPNYSFF